MNVAAIADSIATGVNRAATHSARAAATANGISAASQSAQGAFNQSSVNNANAIGSERLAQQYGFNSAQAAAANAFSQGSWQQTADWNEMMWQKQADWNERMFQQQMEFNAAEAQKNRDWSERMEGTRYQRAMEDMEKAGLNPILAYGGIATGAGSGGAASVGSASVGTASMSPMSGAMGSGGVLNGLSASEGNYTGQMEYLSGALGLFGAAIDGISSAFKNIGQLGNTDLGKLVIELTGNLTEQAEKDAKDFSKGFKNGITGKNYTEKEFAGSKYNSPLPSTNAGWEYWMKKKGYK